MAVQKNNSGANGVRSGRGADFGAGRSAMSARSGRLDRGGAGMRTTVPGRPAGSKKRKLSKKKRAMYRRRRIVALLIVLVGLALIGTCVYSLGRGIGAINTLIHHDDIYAISRDAVPTPKKVSSVKDCTAKDVSLELSSKSQSVGVGGSLDFTATIVYEGSSSCLVDGSDAGRVLTITSGNDTIYRSDLCAADSRMLLMAKGDKDTQTLTWNTDANGSLAECTDEDTWARVNAGTYVAQLSLKDHPKVTSDKVVFTVE
ncbi:hypothetical protein [Bifidobacterium scaligerum]|nr:hypothetical protein [Bifidobacterium scaligerum]